MGHRLEFASRHDSFLQFTHDALANLHNSGAISANQMMSMRMTTLFHQCVTRRPAPKMKPFYQAQSLQHLHRPINRRKITISRRQ